MDSPETRLEDVGPSARLMSPPRYYARQARVVGGYIERKACDFGHALTRDNVIHRSKGVICRTCENGRVGGRPRTKAIKEPAIDAVRRRLAKVYGITYEEYLAMLEKQAGVCAICRRADPRGNGRRSEIMPLVVDHDHDSGQVRGLLCHTCNVSLSVVERQGFIQAATEYLRAHGPRG